MAYRLLTGATGLLGDYLLRDALLADEALAVLVRPERQFDARRRVEHALAGWEARLGRTLPRPVVLEGDVCAPGLGLSATEQDWVAANCRSIIHSGASIRFHADSPESDPYQTNVEGMGNLLECCRKAGIHEFHHISTAYVHGHCDGIAYEEPASGKSFRNDYENSKYQSECLVRGADFLTSVTIYRPSIIVGDSQTSYTSTFHGPYTLLRLGFEFIKRMPREFPDPFGFRKLLEVQGHEQKNLVPVDWVSAVISHIVKRPELHSRIYHLTNTTPASARDIEAAMTEVMIAWVVQRNPAATYTSTPFPGLASFRDQMRLYEDYFSNDPTFDCRQTQQAAPHLPVPPVGLPELKRLSQFAIEHKFVAPKPGLPLEFDVARQLDSLVSPEGLPALAPDVPRNGAAAFRINLEVTGPGGGAWRVQRGTGNVVAACGREFSADCPGLHMNSGTFFNLLHRSLSVPQALDQGLLFVEGSRHAASEAVGTLEMLFHQIRENRISSADGPTFEGLPQAVPSRSGAHV